MTARKPLVLITGSPNTIQEMPAGDTIDPAAENITGAVVGDTDAQTLTNKTLTAPRIEGGIWQGTSPARSIDVVGIASAVNYLQITNQVAGAGPRLRAIGADPNIDAVIEPKGTGVVGARVGGVTRQVATTTGAETLSAKTLVAPTIGGSDWANANHTHADAAHGGQLSYTAFAAGSGVPRTLFKNTADSSAIANTTTSTAFDTGSYSTVLNSIAVVGQLLRITACGRFSNTGTPNLTIRLRGTSPVMAFATTGIFVTPAGVTNELWGVTWIMCVRAIGASGSITTTMPYAAFAGTTQKRQVGDTEAFDFVASGATATNIYVDATWGTASASNTIVLEQMLIEALN